MHNDNIIHQLKKERNKKMGSDMLVNLSRLNYAAYAENEKLLSETRGIKIIRPLSPSFYKVGAFIRETFSEGWESEAYAGMYNKPVSLFVAVDNEKRIVGFACYDATARGFFGPVGVREETRENGVGAALIRKCMADMWEQGYGYAVIGGAGPIGFYEKTVGAITIPDDKPSVYSRML